MSQVADSLKLAMVNLVGTGVAFLALHIQSAEVGLVWTLVFIPPFLGLTLYFGVRDAVKRQRRLQAFLALAVSIPPLLFFRWVAWGFFHFG